MKQLVQSVRSGALELIEVPDPLIGSTEVLVRTSHSVVSAGTERAVHALASSSLLEKARARPDLVRQTVQRARSAGIRSTAQVVRTRLDEKMPLGYSGAGTVLRVGEAVTGLRPGMRVATGGAGHAELQVVSGFLSAPVHDNVELSDAAFATIGAIALQGIRVAGIDVGSRVAVVGLGLIGQIAARLALAGGMRVAGIDLRPWTVDVAQKSGVFALVEAGDDTTRAILDWSEGEGVDAVILTAATSSSEPARRAPALVRDRGTIVVVGDVGLDLKRTPFYEKELSLKFARSYGPGRYERSYEEWGVDYPIGHVRWTEGRNQRTFLSLLASGRLEVNDLVTHRFPFDHAKDGYALLDDEKSSYLGIQLLYPAPLDHGPHRRPPPARVKGRARIGLIGAGNFAQGVLVPSLKKAGFHEFVAVTSATGRSAHRLVTGGPFCRVADRAEGIFADPDIDIVAIASPHNTHAKFAIEAMKAGKHVFCEKPLAITMSELDSVAETWRSGGGHLMIGFNRRHSPSVTRARAALTRSTGPLIIVVRVNAGELPRTHWYFDRRQGGRILGEVCHFVDTVAALSGSDVTRISAFGTGKNEEALLVSNACLLLQCADGSVATVSYAAAGHPTTSKERIEVLGRGHTIVIDDFKELVIDGKGERLAGGQDKGHTQQLVEFRRACEAGGDPKATEVSLQSMRATLIAVEALVTGSPVDMDSWAS